MTGEAGPRDTIWQESVLRTEHLTRVVDDRPLVNDVSIAVDRGDVVAIIGPSGGGKSSLLRLLNRLDEPTSGTVFFEGRDYREIAPRELRRRVGMLLQQPYLFPGSVAENLAFGPAAHGEALAAGRIAELLEQVGLAGYADRDVSRLSGGEAQRVSLARTLLGVERLICSIIKHQQLTCLIVTHDREQAERMAGRAIVMESGRVVGTGPTWEI
jgi:putative ABC transport system ATP-binding protein